MALVSGRSSDVNPNAFLFIPTAEELELLVMMLAEAKDSPAWTDPNAITRPLNGMNVDTKALLKNLTTAKSPKSPKSAAELGKHLDKPPQRINMKCAPRQIHQPR